MQVGSISHISSKQVQISTQTDKRSKSCIPFLNKDVLIPISCIIPKDSIIVKQGELMKVGQKTLVMMTRFFILRDNALFVYYNRD